MTDAAPSARKTIRAFISYSHDSPEHAALVLAFADALRRDGIEAIVDKYNPAPGEGWPQWMTAHVREADFVLMVCSPVYYRRFMGQEDAGVGRGVAWEGNLIDNLIYFKEKPSVSRFIPVLVDGADESQIPDPVRGYTFYRISRFELPGPGRVADPGYERLYRHLTDQPETPAPGVGSIVILPPVARRVDREDPAPVVPTGGGMAAAGVPPARRPWGFMEWARRQPGLFAGATTLLLVAVVAVSLLLVGRGCQTPPPPDCAALARTFFPLPEASASRMDARKAAGLSDVSWPETLTLRNAHALFMAQSLHPKAESGPVPLEADTFCRRFGPYAIDDFSRFRDWFLGGAERDPSLGFLKTLEADFQIENQLEQEGALKQLVQLFEKLSKAADHVGDRDVGRLRDALETASMDSSQKRSEFRRVLRTETERLGVAPGAPVVPDTRPLNGFYQTFSELAVWRQNPGRDENSLDAVVGRLPPLPEVQVGGQSFTKLAGRDEAAFSLLVQVATAEARKNRESRKWQMVDDRGRDLVHETVAGRLDDLKETLAQYDAAKATLSRNTDRAVKALDSVLAPPAAAGKSAQVFSAVFDLIDADTKAYQARARLVSLWTHYHEIRLALYRDLGRLPYKNWEDYFTSFNTGFPGGPLPPTGPGIAALPPDPPKTLGGTEGPSEPQNPLPPSAPDAVGAAQMPPQALGSPVLLDARLWPYVAFLKVYFPTLNGSYVVATGVLVSPRVVLTAGDAMYDPGRGGYPEKVEVTLGGANRVTLMSQTFRSHRQWVEVDSATMNPMSAFDVGCVLLPRQVGLESFAYAMSVEAVTTDVLKASLANVVGYAIKPVGTIGSLYGCQAFFSHVGDTRLSYPVKTLGGMAGGPIYLVDEVGRLTLVGIHTSTLNGQGSAVRITKPLVDLIKNEWMKEVDDTGPGPGMNP
jgi:V8-like Glu-specific endopeptidase